MTAQFRKAALAAGRADLISLWSGQGAPLLKHRRAVPLLRSLAAQTNAALAEPSASA